MAQSVVSKARRAAAIAASMSSFVPSAHVPIASPVAGFTFSNVAPLLARHQPAVDQVARLGREGGEGHAILLRAA